MIFHKLHVVLLAGSLTAVGCNSDDVTRVCTMERRAGINVDVRDSVTNALVGQGSVVVARNGVFADTSEYSPFGPGPYPVGWEMSGNLTLTVTQNGYQPWTKTGIVVTDDGCHVNGVFLIARLQK